MSSNTYSAQLCPDEWLRLIVITCGRLLGAAGLVLILSRNRIKSSVAAVVLALMAATYVIGAVVVVTLGGAEDEQSSRSKTAAQATLAIVRTPGE